MNLNRNSLVAMVMLMVVLVALVEAVYRIEMEMRLHVNCEASPYSYLYSYLLQCCTEPIHIKCSQLFIACSQQLSRQWLCIV